MKSLRTLSLVVIAGLLSACVSANISPEERSTLKRVSMTPIVLSVNPVVFSSQDVIKQVEARPIADYYNDPKLFDNQIRKVTRIIVVPVVSTLP